MTETQSTRQRIPVLRRAITRNAAKLSLGSGLIGLHQICEAAVPFLIGKSVDSAIDGGSVLSLVGWVAILAAVFVALTVTYRFGARSLMYTIAYEAHWLRTEIARHVLVPSGIRSEYRGGELLSISGADAENTSYVLDYVPRVVGAVVAIVVSVIGLLVIDVRVGLIVVIGTPIALAILAATSPKITKRAGTRQKLAGQASAQATDFVTGIRQLHGIGAGPAAVHRYQDVSRRSLTATLSAARLKAVHAGAASAVSALLAAGAALVGVWAALEHRISIGELITVIGLAQFLIEPIGLMAVVASWVAEARASASRIADLLACPPQREPGETPRPGTDPDLTLVDIRTDALDALNLHVAAGEFVGVVAPARCAADLAAVLGNELDYDGEIRVAGVDLATIDPAQRPSLLIAEPHHTDVFAGTVAGNVLGDQPADDRANDALIAASARDIAPASADIWQRPVDERGANLSGGQRQRLALVRALYADPSILVLHDPTTGVDSVTEATIADGVRRYREGKTTIVLTTSPALLAVADRVVLVRDDGSSFQGRHSDLLDQYDDYRSAVFA